MSSYIKYSQDEIKDKAYLEIQKFKEKLPALSFDELRASENAYKSNDPNQFEYQLDFEGGCVHIDIKNINGRCEIGEPFGVSGEEITEDEYGTTASYYDIGLFTEQQLKGE